VIHTAEFPIGVAGTAIISPSAKYGIEFDDQLFDIFPALPPTGKLADPRSKSLHRLRAWPSLRKAATRAVLDVRFLRNPAPQEREVLGAASLLDAALIRVRQDTPWPSV
jgi:hypothetical protein